jgi:membrane-associated protease RseP (regulator of RpoE activity)
MINEPASSPNDRPVLRIAPTTTAAPETQLHEELRVLTMSVMTIHGEPSEAPEVLMARDALMMTNAQSRLVASFEGKLLTDPEAAYEQLDAALVPLNHTPFFRQAGEKHVIHIISGRVQRQPINWVWNALLFIATFFSVLFVGTFMGLSELMATNEPLARQLAANPLPELWRGLPYALAILLILGAHEFGHFFAARYHKMHVSLPYFIPMPLNLLGTMGAVIVQREPHRSRKTLFDVGAAGPLFGLIAAIPILFIGLSTAPTGPLIPGGTVEGNSFIYALAKTIVFGEFLPNGSIDVYMNQLTTAGWAGLLLTAFNLLPVGQLDGGHILYSLVGKRARWLYFPVIIALIGLTFLSEVWFFLLILLLLFGRAYAVPLDDITPLDGRRRAIAFLCIIMFVLTFVPIPLSIVPEGGGLPIPRDNAEFALLGAGVALVLQRLRQ